MTTARRDLAGSAFVEDDARTARIISQNVVSAQVECLFGRRVVEDLGRVSDDNLSHRLNF